VIFSVAVFWGIHVTNSKENITEDSDILENAKRLALSGNYRLALTLIESVIERKPHHVEALRFKGNVIELQGFACKLGDNNYDFINSSEIKIAGHCYEQALLLAPEHTGVLVDLGNYWKNLGNTDKAIYFFDKVIELLSNFDTKNEDFIEAIESKREIQQLVRCADSCSKPCRVRCAYLSITNDLTVRTAYPTDLMAMTEKSATMPKPIKKNK
jgi:tetratricopeptide (TPR) repeat protein